MTLNEFNPDPATSDLLDLVQKMSDAAFRQMDQTRMMEICLAGLVRGFDSQGAALMVRDYEQSWLLCMHLNRQVDPPALAGFQSRILNEYRRLSREDIPGSACTLQVHQSKSHADTIYDFTTWRSFPLEVESNFLGLLVLDLRQEKNPGLQVILHHLCTALIASQNMRQLLITDSMTGCYNRWFMDIELSKFCEGEHPENLKFAVMLVDVDQFKQINDSLGHAAGDQCLVMLADQLRADLSGTDAVIRMGGDEFLLWFPQVGDRDIHALGIQLGQRVAKHLRLPEAPNMPITLSMGIVVHDPGEASLSKETLLDRADQALYLAKRNGRNQAVSWQADQAKMEDAPAMPAELLLQIQTQALQIKTDQEQLMDILEAVLNAKQYETGLHSIRVTRITRYLLDQMDLPETEKIQILRGARLHDIGKIAIPDAILNKQGKLTEQEWTLMRQHTLIGHRFISGFPFLKTAGEIVLYHHEAYDGGGYPKGLKGEQIPYHARLFTLVDAYDSMRANRSYKPFIPRDIAVAELKNKAGSQFDPQLVDFFLSHLPAIEEIGQWEDEPEISN